MNAERSTSRRLPGLVPLQLVIFAIGLRYAVGSGNVPKLIGWVIIVASVTILAGMALAIWRDR